MDLSYEAISTRVDNMLDINTGGERGRTIYFYMYGYLKALLEAEVLNEHEFSELKERVNKHKHRNKYLSEV